MVEVEAAVGRDGNGCGCGDADGSLGELLGERGNTTLAAAVAAAEDCDAAPSLSWCAPPWALKADSRGALASVKLKVGGLIGPLLPLPLLAPSVSGAVWERCRDWRIF